MTSRVASVERYTAAVKLLFDPDNAQVDLLSMEVKVSANNRGWLYMTRYRWLKSIYG